MVALCLYFEVHQPYRLAHTRIRDIGTHADYFDDDKNRSIFEKVARKCYWPAGRLFASLLRRFPGQFKIAFSFTGTFLDQAQAYDPDLLDFYVDLCSLPGVEVLCETSHHSLAALRSPQEFADQVKAHKQRILKLFAQEPRIFRNTELIYDDGIGRQVAALGFEGMLLEGWEAVFPSGISTTHVFSHPQEPLKLLPKCYRLSDDVAFRFSDKGWPQWPLRAETYHSWMERLLDGQHEFVGLFMDYETFGEHQWEETGIFSFVDKWVEIATQDKRFSFVNPSEAIDRFPSRGAVHVPHPLSWADVERDLTAWLGNSLQHDALDRAYALREAVLATKDPVILENWRKLLTSDHFYYMCIKWSQDGDVHKYFSPYGSPYEAYLDYVNVISDLGVLCEERMTKPASQKRSVSSAAVARAKVPGGVNAPTIPVAASASKPPPKKPANPVSKTNKRTKNQGATVIS